MAEKCKGLLTIQIFERAGSDSLFMVKLSCYAVVLVVHH